MNIDDIDREKVLVLLYKYKKNSDGEWMFSREITQKLLGKTPTRSEVVKISHILQKLAGSGRVRVLNDKKGNGRKHRYSLTENGLNYAKILYKSEWYCSHCQDFKEEVYKRPTCKDCGTPVRRKKKSR